MLEFIYKHSTVAVAKKLSSYYLNVKIIRHQKIKHLIIPDYNQGRNYKFNKTII
jgi:hypothetical protein